MSVREDNENKTTSRGLGIAAAAIGVGVGAALYYMFSKRQGSDSEGATTSGWNCDVPQCLFNNDSSFITISEHSTSDTSINSDSHWHPDNDSSMNLNNDSSMILENDSSMNFGNDSSMNFGNDSSMNFESDSSVNLDSDSDDETDSHTDSDSDSNSNESDSELSTYNLESSFEYASINITVDSETNAEWDVTSSEYPSYDTPSPMAQFWRRLRDGRAITEEEQMNMIREQNFRDRSDTLEQCSICFDMMLQDQEVMKLPCTHRFHQECILPWLQERQTCPYCRKNA